MTRLWYLTAGAEDAISVSKDTIQATRNADGTNHLVDAFSPYLRQHAHNPVNWYSWGEEALEKAKRENKPILLSIGYSTCYWCHVLERETFMHEDAAEIMNDNFVNIKVDREVRPDLDEVYMTATRLIRGRGGWPNNLILTPDLKPFSAVTYLPKEKWMEMTRTIGEDWKHNPQEMEDRSNKMETALKRTLAGTAPKPVTIPVEALAQKVYATKIRSYDSRNGGFGTGTKFPQETGLLFLLDHAKNGIGTEAFSMVQNTVDHMLTGGIHDHIGGGFHRYATESRWRVPHFEKMLYNQALMSVVLAQLYEDTGKTRYKHALKRLLHYISENMTDKSGAFYSAQDAETDAVEGAYYVWNLEELGSILVQDDFQLLMSIYSSADIPEISGHKHPDGKVLYRAKNLPDETTQDSLDAIFAQLLSVRAKRKPPLRDEKILTAWNGMMIYGLAESGRIIGNPTYVRHAEKAARFILNNMKQTDGRLYRISMNSEPHQNAFFEDYAWMARGLMALYRVTGNEYYKTETLRLIATVDQYFLDADAGGYFMTDGMEPFFLRIKMGDDSGALPSGNPVMAHVFADLYSATNEQEWQDRINSITSAFAQGITARPYQYSHLIHAMTRIETPMNEWIEKVAETSNEQIPIESKEKVKVKAQIVEEQSTPTQKTVELTIDVDAGWHINANPASLDFLIPTVVDLQTIELSAVKVQYPASTKMETPLGSIAIYEGSVKIRAVVESDEDPIDISKMRALIQLQACHGATCYLPSQIAINLVELTK